MTRWKNKSQAEKEATLAKIKTQRVIKDAQWSAGLPNEIYASGFIPIQCSQCGWTFSEQYQVRDIRDDEMFKIEPNAAFSTYILGTCARCGQKLKRQMPAVISPEFSVFTAVAQSLSEKGKLTDDRNEVGNIFWKRRGKMRPTKMKVRY